MKKEFEDIINDSIKHYGHKQQIEKAVEELTELSLSLQHHADDREIYINVLKEIADVDIMIKKLKIIFSQIYKENVFNLVNIFKAEKLERLQKRMSEEKK